MGTARTIRMCALNQRILSRICRSNPLITLMTMMSTATPSMTPITEIKVMTETNVRLGRKYRRARNNSNGSLDIARRLDGGGGSVNEPGAGVFANNADEPCRTGARTWLSALRLMVK